MQQSFKLSADFVKKYSEVTPPFGFNGLGELVYIRTYSREKENKENEKWWETVERVVNGTYSLQKRHILKYGLGWNELKAQRSAQEMYDRMFNMKFLPPGRGLWAMGTDIIEKRGLAAALNNCAFVSTDDLVNEPTKPFEFLMDMSMLGVGVGFDTKGAGQIEIVDPSNNETELYVIPDTREGWVISLSKLLKSYFGVDLIQYEFDYSIIRKEGEPIKTFGGKASGPDPLIHLHNQIRNLFKNRGGSLITITDIVDIQNMIGCCVVAGNVRRTAEIAFGPYDSEEYLTLKDYRWNDDLQKYEGSREHRSSYGWASNNTIDTPIGIDYTRVGDQTATNGEPGYEWLENMRAYGRMVELPNWKDKRVKGGNPCLEQSLESYELCCLVETFPTRHDSLEDFQRTLKFAYLYAKSVTLIGTHWIETNRVMLRNRRIGTSMSGLAQFIDNPKLGLDKLRMWCETGYQTIQEYDSSYSEWFCVPKSIKSTSIKPSGTVSLLPGVTPGMHWPEDRFYIRRITLPKNSQLVSRCITAGYKVEDSAYDTTSVKVEIPVAIGGVRTVDEVSMWEQVSMAAFLQRYWADNQVSCTVTFKPGLTKQEELRLIKLEQSFTDGMVHLEERVELIELLKKKHNSESDDIKRALTHFQYHLKGISFLPKIKKGAYPQMPYEGISEDHYNSLIQGVKKIDFSSISEDSTPEKFCDGDQCVI